MKDEPAPRKDHDDAGASRSEQRGAQDTPGGAHAIPEGYEPPRVRALGTLPESTGMNTSAQTFPNTPVA